MVLKPTQKNIIKFWIMFLIEKIRCEYYIDIYIFDERFLLQRICSKAIYICFSLHLIHRLLSETCYQLQKDQLSILQIKVKFLLWSCQHLAVKVVACCLDILVTAQLSKKRTDQSLVGSSWKQHQFH